MKGGALLARGQGTIQPADNVTTEGYKFLRLDGNLNQAQRQRDMDDFNKPDSEYFIYLLSTRAGGEANFIVS